MAYVDVPSDSYLFLDNLKINYPSLNSLISEIQGELNLKLWFQVCEHLVELTEKTELHNGVELIYLYENLIRAIEPVFNPMKIMIMLKNIIKNFSGRLSDALVFLEDISKRIDPKGEEKFFMQCLKSECLLGLNQLYECNDLLKEVKVSLENLFDVDHIVYSYFYKLCSQYYEKKQNYDEFYNYALQYFAYINEEKMQKSEKLELCYKMALASIIGEKMFNFSELVEKKYFKSLINSNYEWIYNIVRALSTGKVDQFYSVVKQHEAQIMTEPLLKNKLNFLETKAKIHALLDLVFQKNKNERVLTFKDISNNCQCDYNVVEILCIKALSLGLIKGHIDQVEGLLYVTWIQPKYLEKEKIAVLAERLDVWISNTGKVLEDFQQKAEYLLN